MNIYTYYMAKKKIKMGDGGVVEKGTIFLQFSVYMSNKARLRVIFLVNRYLHLLPNYIKLVPPLTTEKQ